MLANKLDAGLKFESEAQSKTIAGETCVKFLKKNEGGFKMMI